MVQTRGFISQEQVQPRAQSCVVQRKGRRGVLVVLLLLLLLPRTAHAKPGEADFRRFTDYVWLLLGAGAGLALHEGSHLLFDVASDARPTVVGVSLGPFPFFAIQPTNIQSNQQRYAIAQAGFLMQNIYSELILRIDPHLREHHRPLLKGMLAFHVLLSAGYAVTGFADIGPAQSDVNTAARALGVPPWAIGTMLLVPAVCDTYRYFVPDSRWAPWVSLSGKLTMLGATLAF